MQFAVLTEWPDTMTRTVFKFSHLSIPKFFSRITYYKLSIHFCIDSPVKFELFAQYVVGKKILSTDSWDQPEFLKTI